MRDSQLYLPLCMNKQLKWLEMCARASGELVKHLLFLTAERVQTHATRFQLAQLNTRAHSCTQPLPGTHAARSQIYTQAPSKGLS